MTRKSLAALAAATIISTHATADPMVARGAYLATIMDCAGCHSGRTAEGAPDPEQHLTGSAIGFEMPGLGIFWPPNLTSDPTGLNAWTDEQIIAAIRMGVRPDGRMLAPVMPWMSYSALTDEDAVALVAYLRSLPHTAHEVPAPAAPGEAAKAPYFTVAMPE